MIPFASPALGRQAAAAGGGGGGGGGVGGDGAGSAALVGLFTASDMGGLWDVSDASTLFQDVAGTVPITAIGQPVRRINDKSVLGNFLTADDDARRFIFQGSGGSWWLESDGANDQFYNNMAMTAKFDRIMGLRQLSTNYGAIFAGVTVASGWLYATGTPPAIGLFDGAVGPSSTAAAINADAVVTERHDNSNSRLRVDRGSYATGTSGSTAATGLSIGKSPQDGGFVQMRWHGGLQIARSGGGLLSDAEIVSVENWIAGLQGRTL